MYIPEESTTMLVEVQFTVLPEDEWLIGLADLAYFQGIGFSMPIPFDFDQHFVGDPPDIRADEISVIDSEIEDPFIKSENTEVLQGVSIVADELPSQEQEDDRRRFPMVGPNPVVHQDETPILFSLDDPDVSSLYAFLPGLFYCSKHNCSVDGIVIEVSQNRILDMTLSSFRPESIRSFDGTRAMAIDEDGMLTDVEISMSTTGKFSTGISVGSDNDVEDNDSIQNQQSMEHTAFSHEIKLASKLSDSFSPDSLKTAYVSGAIVTGQLMTLLHDIETNGIEPRCRLYLRNRRFPNGTVIDVRYKSLDSIIDLTSLSGIECPKDATIELELRKLAFARLVGRHMEVDIEKSVIDTLNFLRQKLGQRPTKNLLLEQVFQNRRL